MLQYLPVPREACTLECLHDKLFNVVGMIQELPKSAISALDSGSSSMFFLHVK